jgi:SAM-dependent methyltransferase
MSGFSADWLSLREPADHRARAAGLLETLAAWADQRDSLTVLDLGCGTGSNARAMIPHLPGTQHWRLVDYDRALLETAREKLAETSAHKLGAMTVKIEEADLSRGLEPLLSVDCDLVTASALFDLVSKPWLDGMVAALAARRLPLYTVLIYDGIMEWSPAHPADTAVRDAFNAHQQTDKGFGPAAGPYAGVYLAARLSEAGYDIATASSPWLLEPQDQELMLANLEGIGAAAGETGLVGEAELANWLAFRRKGGTCTVGHVDLLALPR